MGLLLLQTASFAFADDPGHTVEESVSLKIAVIGENIVLNRCALLDAAGDNMLGSYVHMGGRMGVVVEGTSSVSEEALHDVALHIAASAPKYVSRDDVTDEILATEKEIALQQAVDQGKPEHIAEKIVQGKMEKFFESEVLLEQPFAKDTSISVGEHVVKSGGADATVVGFVRFKLGEETGKD